MAGLTKKFVGVGDNGTTSKKTIIQIFELTLTAEFTNSNKTYINLHSHIFLSVYKSNSLFFSLLKVGRVKKPLVNTNFHLGFIYLIFLLWMGCNTRSVFQLVWIQSFPSRLVVIPRLKIPDLLTIYPYIDLKYSFVCVLWHVNLCWLFNGKSIFIQITSSISNNSV